MPHGAIEQYRTSRPAPNGRPYGGPTAGARPQSNHGMDWDKLRIFHAVAEAGSFTHAGETLGLSQSAVSRQISALEEEPATCRCSTATPAA
jgi:DNA-binding transcriptional ArsR family regulator